MKKLFICLGTICAFLFAFTFFSCNVYAAEDEPAIVEPEADPSVDVEPTIESEIPESTEVTPDDENNNEFVIDEETLAKIEAILGDILQGEYAEAYNELKLLVGTMVAVTILVGCVLIGIAIKSVRKSIFYNKLLSTLDANQSKKLDEYLTKFEKRTNETQDYVIARMGAIDNSKKEQALAEIDDIRSQIEASKSELSELNND